MSKYVIINADDFGMCNAANRAVEELLSVEASLLQQLWHLVHGVMMQ